MQPLNGVFKAVSQDYQLKTSGYILSQNIPSRPYSINPIYTEQITPKTSLWHTTAYNSDRSLMRLIWNPGFDQSHNSYVLPAQLISLIPNGLAPINLVHHPYIVPLHTLHTLLCCMTFPWLPLINLVHSLALACWPCDNVVIHIRNCIAARCLE